MLFQWIYVPLFFAAITNALQNDRQLRHRLRNGFGNTAHHKRSLSGVALTVKVIQHHGFPPTFSMLKMLFTLS